MRQSQCARDALFCSLILLQDKADGLCVAESDSSCDTPNDDCDSDPIFKTCTVPMLKDFLVRASRKDARVMPASRRHTLSVYCGSKRW